MDEGQGSGVERGGTCPLARNAGTEHGSSETYPARSSRGGPLPGYLPGLAPLPRLGMALSASHFVTRLGMPLSSSGLDSLGGEMKSST